MNVPSRCAPTGETTTRLPAAKSPTSVEMWLAKSERPRDEFAERHEIYLVVAADGNALRRDQHRRVERRAVGGVRHDADEQDARAVSRQIVHVGAEPVVLVVVERRGDFGPDDQRMAAGPGPRARSCERERRPGGAACGPTVSGVHSSRLGDFGLDQDGGPRPAPRVGHARQERQQRAAAAATAVRGRGRRRTASASAAAIMAKTNERP